MEPYGDHPRKVNKAVTVLQSTVHCTRVGWIFILDDPHVRPKKIMTCSGFDQIILFSFFDTMLLLANVKRVNVSHMQDLYIKTEVLDCFFLHGRATNNPIYICITFPNLNDFGVCHFEGVENSPKKGLWNTPMV